MAACAQVVSCDIFESNKLKNDFQQKADPLVALTDCVVFSPLAVRPVKWRISRRSARGRGCSREAAQRHQQKSAGQRGAEEGADRRSHHLAEVGTVGDALTGPSAGSNAPGTQHGDPKTEDGELWRCRGRRRPSVVCSSMLDGQ
ncbi:uncharacterized protein si:ch211-153f2.3 isoform X1 [Syngnathoides biaculeatus]|uniref:uncharacterized protein si:ch211-153f2.3 isoform X1 n=1 Tax=Syngnathoides biaculeatus TaxID=300417 RepID=UPI002ADDBE11|nr:uncharacterized protein si:ch211-153f2.3 isoform X1 [Syngnathoides biaculeatus]